jgi:hypothetical protein
MPSCPAETCIAAPPGARGRLLQTLGPRSLHQDRRPRTSGTSLRAAKRPALCVQRAADACESAAPLTYSLRGATVATPPGLRRRRCQLCADLVEAGPRCRTGSLSVRSHAACCRAGVLLLGPAMQGCAWDCAQSAGRRVPSCGQHVLRTCSKRKCWWLRACMLASQAHIVFACALAGLGRVLCALGRRAPVVRRAGPCGRRGGCGAPAAGRRRAGCGQALTAGGCARRPALRVAGLPAQEALPARQGQDQGLPAR